MLRRPADIGKQCQSFSNAEPMLITVGGDTYARDILHDEVWLAVFRDACVIEVRNSGVVHLGKRLSFAFK